MLEVRLIGLGTGVYVYRQVEIQPLPLLHGMDSLFGDVALKVRVDAPQRREAIEQISELRPLLRDGAIGSLASTPAVNDLPRHRHSLCHAQKRDDHRNVLVEDSLGKRNM